MRKWRWLIAGALTGAMLTGALAPIRATGQTFVNWPRYLYSMSHTSDNPAATAITPANVAQLQAKWSFKPSAAPISGLSGFRSSPVVYNGVVYIGARNGYFYAINEATGTVVWQRFIGFVTAKTCGAEGFTSTATVQPDPTTGKPTVYVYGATGYLYAMNAANGSNVWPPAVVAIPSATTNDYYAWSSPLVFKGNIYVGVSSQCDAPLVRGGLKEFSQASGALENTFWTTPAGTRGASIWSSAATDGTSLYVTTGNGLTTSLGDSIIKLNPSLTKMLGIFTLQTPAGSDFDFGGSPGLWTASIGGVATEMVGACSKNGTFYALAASDVSAGAVWQRQIGEPDSTTGGQCDAAPVSHGSKLYLASNTTTINGRTFDGSIRQVDPATGAVSWQTGLTGSIIGTPGMDGGGVIAAQSFGSTTNGNGVFLISATTGHILSTFSYATDTFGQPAFADNYVFVANNVLRAYAVG